jgi:hypothetical protein
MYWIYLSIFVLAVLTPEIIQDGWSYLSEEDLESLLVLLFGTFGIAVYFIKEKAILQLFRERLRLQKQANVITKDLSDSYSYIGEMNRRFDIVRDLVFHLPEKTAAALASNGSRPDNLYAPIIEAIQLLSKAESISIRFTDAATGRVVRRIDDGSGAASTCFAGEDDAEIERTFHEEDGCVLVRAPGAACGVTASIIFPKTANRIEDADIFRMIASEALSLYCIEQRITGKHTE